MIHQTAIIQKGAKIGKNVKIGAYAYISEFTTLNDGVEIYQGAQIHGQTILDKNVKVFSYAIIGSAPQDISYKEEDFAKVEIGEGTIIREFATINGGTNKSRGTTIIGKNTYMMAYTHVAHDCIVGNNVILANNATLAGHVEVGDFTVIGGLTPVHQFVKIGEGCMIGGASALAQDIPPFCLAEGNRAVVKSLNLIGLRRRFDREDINALQIAYKKLFRNTVLIQESAQDLIKNTKNVNVAKMCRFILNTKRGIPFKRVK